MTGKKYTIPICRCGHFLMYDAYVGKFYCPNENCEEVIE